MLLCLFCIDKIMCLCSGCSGRGSYLCMYARIRTAYYIIESSYLIIVVAYYVNARVCVCVYTSLYVWILEWFQDQWLSLSACLILFAHLRVSTCLSLCRAFGFCAPSELITVSIWCICKCSLTNGPQGRSICKLWFWGRKQVLQFSWQTFKVSIS